MATAHHPEEHEYLTVAEAASWLRIDPSTIWRWIKAGRLPARRLGPRTVRIHRADLEAMDQPVAARPTPPHLRVYTLEETRARLGQPATAEEMERWRSWYDEWQSRERPSIAPLTSVDLIRAVRKQQRERYDRTHRRTRG